MKNAKTKTAGKTRKDSTDLIALDHAAQIAAISKSQAVIEFNLAGTVITANENFLNVLGYRLDEIQGRPASMAHVKASKAA